MKKKLLSLVLAGAMVASTSVSAFATTAPTHVGNGEIKGSDDKEYTTDVEITGQVLNNAGDIPAGTFNVTVPTAASFTVDQSRNVISVPITIQNNGAQSIDVYAEKFLDITPGEGQKITVTKSSELKDKNRSFVNLTLKGKLGVVHLKTEENNISNKKGIYKDSELATEATGEELKLTSISNEESGVITLSGNAGDAAITDSVSDNFTLTLKIKKSTTH